MWFFNQKRRVREVVLQIAKGLADGTLVPDPPLAADPPLVFDAVNPQSQGDGQQISPEANGSVASLDDCIVVEPLEACEKAAGGVILLDTAALKPQRGRVLAIGTVKVFEGDKRVPFPVAEGDEVLYGKYAGKDAKFGTKDVKILHESDIVAKFVQ